MCVPEKGVCYGAGWMYSSQLVLCMLYQPIFHKLLLAVGIWYFVGVFSWMPGHSDTLGGVGCK